MPKCLDTDWQTWMRRKELLAGQPRLSQNGRVMLIDLCEGRQSGMGKKNLLKSNWSSGRSDAGVDWHDELMSSCLGPQNTLLLCRDRPCTLVNELLHTLPTIRFGCKHISIRHTHWSPLIMHPSPRKSPAADNAITASLPASLPKQCWLMSERRWRGPVLLNPPRRKPPKDHRKPKCIFVINDCAHPSDFPM